MKPQPGKCEILKEWKQTEKLKEASGSTECWEESPAAKIGLRSVSVCKCTI